MSLARVLSGPRLVLVFEALDECPRRVASILNGHALRELGTAESDHQLAQLRQDRPEVEATEGFGRMVVT